MKALCKVPDGVALLYPDQRGGEGGVQDAALGGGGVVSGATLSLRLHPGAPIEGPESPARPSAAPHLQATVTTATVATDHHLPVVLSQRGDFTLQSQYQNFDIKLKMFLNYSKVNLLPT